MRLLLAALTLAVLPALGQEQPQAPRAIPVETPAAASPQTPDIPAAPGASVSRTKQFRVSGTDFALRGSVAMLAEEAKSDLLRLTEDDKDAWKIPINIQLRGIQGEPAPDRPIAQRIFINESGYQIQLDVHIGRGIDHAAFLTHITTALIHERALRQKHPEDTRFNVPPWLVEGLREANAWRIGQGDRRLYQKLLDTGGIYKISDLFEIDTPSHHALDSVMRTAFRASSGALVMALLEQPQGLEGFRDFLTDIPTFQGEMPLLLRRHFPELNLSATSLAKWWALQLAAKGATPLTEVLTVAETDTALTEALVIHLRDPEGNLLKTSADLAWQTFPDLEKDERIETLRPPQDALTRLSLRCFPSHRPIIAEYQSILLLLQNGSVSEVETRLADLAATRAVMLQKTDRARDYLDWFEITRARDTSGAFDDYLNLKARLKDNPHQRKDPLSIYLDRMDKLFTRDPLPNP